MKSRKYKESYRLVENGPGERRSAEYVGEYYALGPGGPGSPWAVPGAGTALFWAFALLYLRFSPVTGRCMYAVVPVIAALLPGFYALLGLISALRAPQRMTVVQKENGPGRLTRAALGCGALAAVGAAGGAVFLTLGGRWAEGWWEPLLAALASACAWLAFARARRNYNRLRAA